MIFSQILVGISSITDANPQKVLPKARYSSALLLGFSFLILCLSMCSCGTSRQVTQLVHDVRIYTVYMTNQQYDSIYIYKDKMTDRSKDTIYIKEVSEEYRYKLLRDTIKVIQRDSIPYEVTVIETKEIERPLTWFDKTCRATLFFLLGILLFWIFKKL